MSSRCAELKEVGWQEFICRISGVSVPADCPAANQRADGLITCIPLKARAYRQGTLALSALPGDEREAVKAMAESMPEEKVGTGDLESLPLDRLEDLIERAQERRRFLVKFARRVPLLQRRMQTCERRRDLLDREIEQLGEEIERAARGLPPKLISAPATPKRRPGRPPGQHAGRSRRRSKSAQRLQKIHTMLDTSAKRYGWSAERLAQEKAKHGPLPTAPTREGLK